MRKCLNLFVLKFLVPYQNLGIRNILPRSRQGFQEAADETRPRLSRQGQNLTLKLVKMHGAKLCNFRF